MYSINLINRFHSLEFRLAIFYSVLFGIVSCIGIYIIDRRVEAYFNIAEDSQLQKTGEKLSYYVRFKSIESVQDEFDREADVRGTHQFFCCLISPSGEIAASSDLTDWKMDTIVQSFARPSNKKTMAYTTIPLNDERIKARAIFIPFESGSSLVVGSSVGEYELFMSHFRIEAMVILLAMVIVGTFGGMRVSRRALQGVEEVIHAANHIAEGQFDDRVHVYSHGEEITRLGNAFNKMAERIQILMTEMRETNDNIAHDLRSPITRIRGMAETSIMGYTSKSEFDDTLGSIIEECDRLLNTINTVLDIAEVEAGVHYLRRDAVDFNHLVQQTMELFLPYAEERGINLHEEISSVPNLSGDLAKLQRCVSNLLDNAIKYTQPGGTVSVTLFAIDSAIMLSISDTGIGIPESEQKAIFERFFRGDRSRNMPGNGLGLSFAAAVVKAHGGTIEVSSTFGKGSTFSLSLPLFSDSKITK